MSLNKTQAELAQKTLSTILNVEAKTSKPDSDGNVNYVKAVITTDLKQHQIRSLAELSTVVPKTMTLKRSGKGMSVTIGTTPKH